MFPWKLGKEPNSLTLVWGPCKAIRFRLTKLGSSHASGPSFCRTPNGMRGKKRPAVIKNKWNQGNLLFKAQTLS